jgi:hypothetical protein
MGVHLKSFLGGITAEPEHLDTRQSEDPARLRSRLGQCFFRQLGVIEDTDGDREILRRFGRVLRSRGAGCHVDSSISSLPCSWRFSTGSTFWWSFEKHILRDAVGSRVGRAQETSLTATSVIVPVWGGAKIHFQIPASGNIQQEYEHKAHQRYKQEHQSQSNSK